MLCSTVRDTIFTQPEVDVLQLRALRQVLGCGIGQVPTLVKADTLDFPAPRHDVLSSIVCQAWATVEHHITELIALCQM